MSFPPLDRPLARFSPPVQGAIYMTLAAIGFSGMNALIRGASAELEPLQIAFFRNLFALLFMLPWLMSRGLAGAKTKRIGGHLWRSGTGLIAMICWFYSLALLPLAQAVALNFVVPIFATAGAALVLGEVVRARRWSATVIGFLGVLVILRPGFGAFTPEMLLPVAAAAFMATSTLTVKSLSRTDSPAVIVFYMNLLLTPLSLVPALFVWRWPGFEVWGLLIALGLLGSVSQLMMSHAYTRADASAVLPFDYIRLPGVAVIGFLAFGEVPDIWVWLGAFIIAGSSIYIARREAQVARIKAAAESVKIRP